LAHAARVDQAAKLLASDGAVGDRFGKSVSLDGDTAIVGADFHDNNGISNSGSAYIFHFDGTNWNQEASLLASDGAENDYLGNEVSIDGDVAIVGAQYDDNENGTDAGSAYLFGFDGTNWKQEAKLLASDGAAGDHFGWYVSIDGDVAIVGAPFDDDNGTDSGSAYIFAGVGDCNDNGVADICDIANGDSKDENGNGIPDECEDCTGKEKIKRTHGNTICRNGVIKKLTIIVKLANGVPDDTVVVQVLDADGNEIASKHRKINGRGKARARVKSKGCNNFSPGPFTAIATWGCGVKDSKAGSVPEDCRCP